MRIHLYILHILCILFTIIGCSFKAQAVPADSEPVEGANIAVAYKLPNHDQIIGSNYDIYFHPASTQKLLTGLAAILSLGHDYKIKTSLAVPQNLLQKNKLQLAPGGVLNGDLLIRFAGDPSFTDAHYRQLIQSLKKAGVNKIAGSIILDISRFGGRSRGSGWSWDDLPVCFTAPAHAIIINRNCAFAQLQPHGEGKIASVIVPKGMPIEVMNDAVGIKAKSYGKNCELEAEMYLNNKYHIRGCVPIQEKNQPWPLSLSISDPLLWGVDWTAALMTTQQISYASIKVTYVPLDGFADYFVHESESMDKLVQYMLFHSNNLYADAIAKNVAAEYYHDSATYKRVASAIREILFNKAQLNLGAAHLVDGSGLSPHNLITAHQLLDLLDFINRNDKSLDFVRLMPVAGQSGTLKWRGSVLKAPLVNNVIAKTGALTNVSNLAGLITIQSGVRVPFVIFSNGLTYTPKVRDDITYKRIAQPSLKYERYVLEQIYAQKIMGSEF